VAVTAQFGGDVLVGRVVGPGGPQDDAAAEDQRLGAGPGADQTLQAAPEIIIQWDNGGEGARHGDPPCEPDTDVTLQDMMPTDLPFR